MLLADGEDTLIAIRVTPRAAANKIKGDRDGRLAVSVRAAPADGAANLALVKTLAKALNVPPSRVQLERGTRGREKACASSA